MSELRPEQESHRLWALIPALVGVACALVAIRAFGFQRVEFGDANDYITAARTFLDGMPYPRTGDFHPMFRPPLFPLFVAGVWKIFPGSVVALKVGQALLHGATCLVIYFLGYELVRRRLPALLGALVCAVNPLLIGLTVDFFTEPLHTLLLALGWLFLVRLLKDRASPYLHAALAGIAFGLATLCRPSALGVVLCMLPVLALLKAKEVGRTRAFAASAVVFVCMFAAIAPWTLYNYRTTGELILVNDGGGYNFWLGSVPASIRIYEGQFKDAEENQRFADYFWGQSVKDKLAELERTDHYSSLRFNEREKVWRREAFKNIKQDYGLSARITFGKFRAFWTPFLNRLVYGWKFVALIALFVIGLYVCGAYGAYILSRERLGREFVILLGVSFIVATLVHMVFMGIVRYRVPYADAYLSMLTGIALWQLGTKFFTKRT